MVYQYKNFAGGLFMNDQKFHEQYERIVAKIDSVPAESRDALLNLAKETKERHDSLKSSFGRMRESLSDLQLHLTYLIFDLEATRRERNS